MSYRVLQVVDGFGWGGTKEQVYLTTRELAKRGVDVGIALSFQYGEMVEKLKPYGVRIHFFEDHKGSKSRFNPLNWWRLKRIIEDYDYDIVVGNSPHAVDYIRFTLPFLRRKPKLVFVRRSDRIPSAFSRWWKYCKADRLVVISKNFYKKLINLGICQDKVKYIPSGLDLTRFYPAEKPLEKQKLRKKLKLPTDGKIFINVANWNPQVKGQKLLLQAFKELKCSKCYLILAGYNTNGSEALALIKNLGLQKRVIPLGFRKDIPELLRASDFGVYPSFIEGLGNAILQSMASGLVVIATSTEGISSYLRDGENGFLVPVGDKEKLLRAMEKALNLSEEEYRQIGERAMETAKGYSIERTAEGYIELFEELMEERG